MGRLKGSVNRSAEDKVSVLRQWLSLVKIQKAVGGGCQWCASWFPGQPVERAPFRLSFLHRDPETREFDISQAPNLQGMTKERLETEIGKCDLICRRCLGSLLEARKEAREAAPERLVKRKNQMSGSMRRRLETEQEYQNFINKRDLPSPETETTGGI